MIVAWLFGLARLQPGYPAGKLNQAWRNFESELDALIRERRLAA